MHILYMHTHGFTRTQTKDRLGRSIITRVWPSTIFYIACLSVSTARQRRIDCSGQMTRQVVTANHACYQTSAWAHNWNVSSVSVSFLFAATNDVSFCKWTCYWTEEPQRTDNDSQWTTRYVANENAKTNTNANIMRNRMQ